ncbi:MAG: DUF3558 family protein [Acidobacteriota bacterium]
MRTTHLGYCLLAGLLAACGGSDAKSEAQKTAAALRGEDKVAASNNPQCKLFTPAELKQYVGETLSAGQDAAMGSGCQWTSSGEASAMIQVVPARYHELHSAAPTFRSISDADSGGTQGFVEKSLGDWNAGAISGPEAVVVSVGGPAASDAAALALLRETIARRGKHAG